MASAFLPVDYKNRYISTSTPISPTKMAGFLSSNYNDTKRKRQSMTSEDFEYERTKQARVQSPRFDRRATFPCDHNPGMMVDSSNTNSDSEQDVDHDQTMEVDMDGDMGMDSQATIRGEHPHIVNLDEGHTRNESYSFGQAGTGGFGFGPGAEEDEEDMDAHLSSYPQLKVYPSLTNHTNPHHFSNLPPSSSSFTGRPKSPFSAQAFSTTLRAPSPARGLLQPTINSSLPPNASDVEKARTAHGAHCKRIPKLVLSDYPDPATGQRSMWTVCEDCGTVERAA